MSRKKRQQRKPVVGFSFFERLADGDCPAGVTVTKGPALPDGDFHIDEHNWGNTSLWFVAEDNFTEDERQAAFEGYQVYKLVRSFR